MFNSKISELIDEIFQISEF